MGTKKYNINNLFEEIKNIQVYGDGTLCGNSEALGKNKMKLEILQLMERRFA